MPTSPEKQDPGARSSIGMEAIAAAGALPGLASATIQLGTATFQFYQQLHSLYKAIKHGENDLSTAVRRLDQHGDFIKGSIPNP